MSGFAANIGQRAGGLRGRRWANTGSSQLVRSPLSMRTLNVSENSSDAAPGIIFPTLGNYLSKCRDCKHNGGDEDRTCTGEKGNHVADLRTAR